MTVTTDVVNRTINESKFRWLGAHAGLQYGIHGGQEFAVERRSSDPSEFIPQPGEVLVTRKRVEVLEDGAKWETDVTSRAWPVPSGTFEKLAKSRKPSSKQRIRAWDRLAVLDVMQRKEPARLIGGPPVRDLPVLPGPPLSKAEEEAVAGVVGLLRERPHPIVEVGGNVPPQSVAGMVDYLAQRGVELSLARGHLVARSVNPIRADLRELVEQAHDLLSATLQGTPLVCSMCTEPAVTIVFPRAPMCSEHAQ